MGGLIRIIVHRAVGFDNESQCVTEKIRDVGTNAVLPTEFQSMKAPVAEHRPQSALDAAGCRALRSAGIKADICGGYIVHFGTSCASRAQEQAGFTLISQALPDSFSQGRSGHHFLLPWEKVAAGGSRMRVNHELWEFPLRTPTFVRA
jgi:hypothetical protein